MQRIALANIWHVRVAGEMNKALTLAQATPCADSAYNEFVRRKHEWRSMTCMIIWIQARCCESHIRGKWNTIQVWCSPVRPKTQFMHIIVWSYSQRDTSAWLESKCTSLLHAWSLMFFILICTKCPDAFSSLWFSKWLHIRYVFIPHACTVTLSW